MKRSISTTLLLTLLLSFSGCQSMPVETEQTPIQEDSNLQTENTETENQSQSGVYPLTLPETTWDGRVFNVLGMSDSSGYSQFKNFEITSDGETGEVVNDAVFHRNLLLEEKYNVKITEHLDYDPHIIEPIKLFL